MSQPPAESGSASRPIATLRQFVRQADEKASVEHCELCGGILAADHSHIIEPASRRLICACDACAILFDEPTGGRFRRVPRRGRFLPDFVLTDAQWDDLLIPINMAFFLDSSLAGKFVAMYPSPAGAMESLLSLATWQALVEDNPVLCSMQSDVEALLVNRLGAARGFANAEYYVAPIDECYKLVGLIRNYWRGFSGGSEVWPRIAEFFTQLKERSVPTATMSGSSNSPARSSTG